jgi:hypothetical protein
MSGPLYPTPRRREPRRKRLHRRLTTTTGLLLLGLLTTLACSNPTGQEQIIYLAEQLEQARFIVPTRLFPLDGSGRSLMGPGWLPWRPPHQTDWWPRTRRRPGELRFDLLETRDITLQLAWANELGAPRRILLNGEEIPEIRPRRSEEYVTIATLAARAEILRYQGNILSITGAPEGTAVAWLKLYHGIAATTPANPAQQPRDILTTVPSRLDFPLTIPEHARFTTTVTIEPLDPPPDNHTPRPITHTVSLLDGSGNRITIAKQTTNPSQTRKPPPLTADLSPFRGRHVILIRSRHPNTPAHPHLHPLATTPHRRRVIPRDPCPSASPPASSCHSAHIPLILKHSPS